MGKTKVYKFDVSSATPQDVETLRNRLNLFTPLTDDKIDSKTLKLKYIRAYFESDVNVKQLVTGLSNVNYTDITGINLFNT